jgi:hypothetical protein
MSRSVFSVTLLLVCIFAVHHVVFAVNMDLWFMLTEGKPRCFLEDVPKDTLVVGVYDVEGEGLDQYKSGIQTAIYDPASVIVFQRDLKVKGKFAFTSQIAGEHRICIQTNKTGGWFSSKQVVSVEEIGEEEEEETSGRRRNRKQCIDGYCLFLFLSSRKFDWTLKVVRRLPIIAKSPRQSTSQVSSISYSLLISTTFFLSLLSSFLSFHFTLSHKHRTGNSSACFERSSAGYPFVAELHAWS